MLIEEYKEILAYENVSFEDFKLICEDAIKEIEKRDATIEELKETESQTGVQLETEEQRGMLITIIEGTHMQGSFQQVKKATAHLTKLLNSIQTASILMNKSSDFQSGDNNTEVTYHSSPTSGGDIR